MRQPMLKPSFYEQGFQLISPKRSQISVDTIARFKIRNSRGSSLVANLRQRCGEKQYRCKVSPESTFLNVTCALPRPGEWKVAFYSAELGETVHSSVGHIQVNGR